jgi:hypothetical protein
MKCTECKEDLKKIKNPHKEYNRNEEIRYQIKMNRWACGDPFQFHFGCPESPDFNDSEHYKCENENCKIDKNAIFVRYDPKEGMKSGPTDDSWELTIVNKNKSRERK